MDQRRGRFQRFHRIVDVRQLLILDIDQADRLVSNRFAVSGHSGHRIADHANFVASKNWLILHPATDVNAFHVRASEHDAHARQSFGSCRVDFDNPRVRH
jgi:hypothetical protein